MITWQKETIAIHMREMFKTTYLFFAACYYTWANNFKEQII